MSELRIIRKDEVSLKYGKRETAVDGDVKAGLLTPPVQIGGRAIGWPLHEVEAVIRGRIVGMPDSELRELVQRLVADRAKLREELAA